MHCPKVFSDGRLEYLKRHITNECTEVPAHIKLDLVQRLAQQAVRAEQLKDSSRKAKKRSKVDNGQQDRSQSRLVEHFDSRAPSQDQANTLDTKLLRMLIMNGVPFNVVRSPWFLDFIAELRPAYIPAGQCMHGVPLSLFTKPWLQ